MNHQDLIASFMANMTDNKTNIAINTQNIPSYISRHNDTNNSSVQQGANKSQEEDKSMSVKGGGKRCHKRNKRFEHPLTSIVQVINKPREHMNHSYNDFSLVPPESVDMIPTKVEEMTFAQKIHHILSQDCYSQWISWLPHGRSFKIHVPTVFEREVLLKYFGHKRYSSFLRQLNNHGFKHISKGPDRNTYYHELMLRGMPHLAKHMPEPRDARRLIPDPDNEPNFYEISSRFPLIDAKPKVAVAPPSAANNSMSFLFNHISPPKAPGCSTLSTFQNGSFLQGKPQGMYTTFPSLPGSLLPSLGQGSTSTSSDILSALLAAQDQQQQQALMNPQQLPSMNLADTMAAILRQKMQQKNQQQPQRKPQFY